MFTSSPSSVLHSLSMLFTRPNFILVKSTNYWALLYVVFSYSLLCLKSKYISQNSVFKHCQCLFFRYDIPHFKRTQYNINILAVYIAIFSFLCRSGEYKLFWTELLKANAEHGGLRFRRINLWTKFKLFKGDVTQHSSALVSTLFAVLVLSIKASHFGNGLYFLFQMKRI